MEELFRFKVGAVVLAKIYPAPIWGHVTGFEFGPMDKPYVRVKFINGDEYGVNPELLRTEYIPR